MSVNVYGCIIYVMAMYGSLMLSEPQWLGITLELLSKRGPNYKFFSFSPILIYNNVTVICLFP